MNNAGMGYPEPTSHRHYAEPRPRPQWGPTPAQIRSIRILAGQLDITFEQPWDKAEASEMIDQLKALTDKRRPKRLR